MVPVTQMPLFTYGSLADGATYYEIVGRHPDAVAAVLPGFRVQHSLGYAYVIEDEESQVEGFLVRNLHAPDYWILDDYQGTEQGLYERRPVSVRIGAEPVEAMTYVGGPSMIPPAT